MFDIERWQELLETIWKNRLRTLLTGLSVSSGIFILVVLLGFGRGMGNGIEAEFEVDSTTSIWIWPETTTLAFDGLNPGRPINFSLEEYYELERMFQDRFEYGSPRMFVRGVSAVYRGELLAYSLEAVNGDHQFIENQRVVDGRYLNPSDMDNRAKVVLVGRQLVQEAFGDLDSPVGEYMTLSGIPFQIVGVYADANEREEQRFFVPITTAEVVFSDRNRVANYNFTLEKKPTLQENLALTQRLKNDMLQYLKSRHRVAPEDEGAIYIWSAVEEAERYYNLVQNMSLFFWFVGLCTIIAGVVGVGNIMLIVVRERTRELGIRKALGARPWSLIGLILHEALFVTVVSGGAGLIASMGLLELVGPQLDIDYIENPSVDFGIALSTVVVLVVAGTLAGLLPAVRAARTEVINALKEE